MDRAAPLPPYPTSCPTGRLPRPRMRVGSGSSGSPGDSRRRSRGRDQPPGVRRAASLRQRTEPRASPGGSSVLHERFPGLLTETASDARAGLSASTARRTSTRSRRIDDEVLARSGHLRECRRRTRQRCSRPAARSKRWRRRLRARATAGAPRARVAARWASASSATSRSPPVTRRPSSVSSGSRSSTSTSITGTAPRRCSATTRPCSRSRCTSGRSGRGRAGRGRTPRES